MQKQRQDHVPIETFILSSRENTSSESKSLADQGTPTAQELRLSQALFPIWYYMKLDCVDL
jgi:hypothetical protein